MTVWRDPRATGRYRRLLLDLLPDALYLRYKRANFEKCARIGSGVFLSRDFSYEAHPRGDIRYELGDFVSLRGCALLARGRGRISIGECSVLNPGCRVEAHHLVEIGRNVQIAHDVSIFDTNSHDTDPDRRAAALRRSLGLEAPGADEEIASAPVRIDDGAWIGMHAIILKGVTIGKGAIVAAGAVVTDDVAPRTIAAGNPARVIKQL